MGVTECQVATQQALSHRDGRIIGWTRNVGSLLVTITSGYITKTIDWQDSEVAGNLAEDVGSFH